MMIYGDSLLLRGAADKISVCDQRRKEVGEEKRRGKEREKEKLEENEKERGDDERRQPDSIEW